MGFTTPLCGARELPLCVSRPITMQEPGKPLVMSECCSCETQRGEDADMQSV